MGHLMTIFNFLGCFGIKNNMIDIILLFVIDYMVDETLFYSKVYPGKAWGNSR